MSDLEIKPTDLVARTGLDPAQISRWLSGDRERVPPLAALYFAGLAPNEIDRQYWVDQSVITDRQRELLAKALHQQPVKLTGIPHHWARALAGILASGDKTAKEAVQQQLVLWFRQATGEELIAATPARARKIK